MAVLLLHISEDFYILYLRVTTVPFSSAANFFLDTLNFKRFLLGSAVKI
jgi:hypothetical protein